MRVIEKNCSPNAARQAWEDTTRMGRCFVETRQRYPPKPETTLAVCELCLECQKFEEAAELTEACGVSFG